MNDRRATVGTIYYQVASVLLLLTCVGFAISGLWAIVRLGAPTVTLNEWAWREVETIDAFIENRYREDNGRYYSLREPPPERPGPDVVAPESLRFTPRTRAEVEERWRSERQRVINGERRGGVRQALLSAIALVIAMLLYLWHHREVKRSRVD